MFASERINEIKGFTKYLKNFRFHEQQIIKFAV